MSNPTTLTPQESGDVRLRAGARLLVVARRTDEVSSAAKLHCLAAVGALDLPAEVSGYLIEQRQVFRHQPPERLLRAALGALGSLPPRQFSEVRVAAMHARRALRALH